MCFICLFRNIEYNQHFSLYFSIVDMVVGFLLIILGINLYHFQNFKKGDLLPYYSKMINIQIDKYRIDR